MFFQMHGKRGQNSLQTLTCFSETPCLLDLVLTWSPLHFLTATGHVNIYKDSVEEICNELSWRRFCMHYKVALTMLDCRDTVV